MASERKWSIEQEINLFSLVCDYKPAGSDKDKNITRILLCINENIADSEKFTEEQVWAKLRHYFDLEKVEIIERYAGSGFQPLKRDEKARANTKSKPKEASARKSSVDQSAKPEDSGYSQGLESNQELAQGQENKEHVDIYSSELSDVAGEETEVEKLKDKESLRPPPKKAKRGRPKKALQAPVKKTPIKDVPMRETPSQTPRKRTRSIVKDGDDESTPKRRQLTPLTPNSKRKDVFPDPREVIDPEIFKDDERFSALQGEEKEVKSESKEEDKQEEGSEAAGVEPAKEMKQKKRSPGPGYTPPTDANTSIITISTGTPTTGTTEDTIYDSEKGVENPEDEPKTRKARRQPVRRSTRIIKNEG